MRVTVIALLCTCVWLVSGDGSALKTKFKLLGRLKEKHHKRGIFSQIPPYKVGHDIPVVTHSVLKPIVVSYPPTASVSAVKVPLSHSFVHRYPAPVGHPVRGLPHPHYGLKFPHHKIFLSKPEPHFYHHHVHVEQKPILPLLPATPPAPGPSLVPIAASTAAEAHPIPVPSPSFIAQPTPLAPPPAVSVAPSTLSFIPQEHIHLKPVLPSVQSISPLLPPAPVFPYASQYPYFLRPGNAVQTSFFANYPRYPLVDSQYPIIPLTAPAAPAHLDQVYLEQPHVPQFHFPQQFVAQDEHPVIDNPTTLVGVQQNGNHLPQPPVHLQPATLSQTPLDHNGWSPVSPQNHALTPVIDPEHHQFIHQQSHDIQQHFNQDEATQVFQNQAADEQQYHAYQHHIQQQIEQSQYDQHLNNQHQLNTEYGVPQEHGQEQNFGQEYSQQNQNYAQQAQEYAQQAHHYAQQAQEYAQHNQEYAQTNQFLQQHLSQEYGVPQHLNQVNVTPHQALQGRSEENESDTQLYHNHIPLGLQPPIDRPLEHFR